MKENIIKIRKIITYVLLILLFLVNLIILGFHCSIITITSIITQNFDIQVLLFGIVTLGLLISFVFLFFIKSLNKIRIPLLLVLLILQIIDFRFSFYIPSVNKAIEIEACLDRGYCWDYIRNKCEKNDQGFCFKNKQECNDRNGYWKEDKQYCELQ